MIKRPVVDQITVPSSTQKEQKSKEQMNANETLGHIELPNTRPHPQAPDEAVDPVAEPKNFESEKTDDKADEQAKAASAPDSPQKEAEAHAHRTSQIELENAVHERKLQRSRKASKSHAEVLPLAGPDKQVSDGS